MGSMIWCAAYASFVFPVVIESHICVCNKTSYMSLSRGQGAHDEPHRAPLEAARCSAVLPLEF